MCSKVLFQRTSVDFWNAFEIQKTALEVSSLAFDGGMMGEAARLATSAFLLVGRGMRNHTSVLDHLGITESIQFPTTVLDGSESGTPLVYCCLELVRNNPETGSAEWVIELLPRGRLALQTGRALKFEEWWDETVLDNGQGQRLTRRDIIRILRDKDGGAHYDANVTDPLIASALQGQITGFKFKSTETADEIPVSFVLENTMRQIAEELRKVLRYLRVLHDPSMPHSRAS
jgi:hypothetical protein